MKTKPLLLVAFVVNLFIVSIAFILRCSPEPNGVKENEEPKPRTMLDGKAIFRYETFGDEVFWTDKLQLHKAIAASKPPDGSFNKEAATRGKVLFNNNFKNLNLVETEKNDLIEYLKSI